MEGIWYGHGYRSKLCIINKSGLHGISMYVSSVTCMPKRSYFYHNPKYFFNRVTFSEWIPILVTQLLLTLSEKIPWHFCPLYRLLMPPAIVLKYFRIEVEGTASWGKVYIYLFVKLRPPVNLWPSDITHCNIHSGLMFMALLKVNFQSRVHIRVPDFH